MVVGPGARERVRLRGGQRTRGAGKSRTSAPSHRSLLATMPAPRQSQPRAAVPFILITVLLDTLGVGLIIPVGPRLVASFLHDDLEAAARWFGVLMSLYSVMQFVFAPILGGLSDR